MLSAIRPLSTVTVVLVFAVVVAAVAFLLLPFGLGEELRSRGAFLAPLLASVALLVSGFALLVSVRTAEASFRAEEQVKEDIATLLSALRTMRIRLRLAPVMGDFDNPVQLVQYQREVIDRIMTSTTGYAFGVWEGRESERAGGEPSEWRVLPIYLFEVLAAKEPATVGNRALRLEGLFEALSAAEIREMASYVSDLAESTRLFAEARGVLDMVDKPTTSSDETKDDAMDSNELIRQFEAVKAAGVDDPDVDMFLAVLRNSEQQLKDALNRGANPNITDTELLRKHAAYLPKS